MGRYTFENLLIAFFISRQRKQMSSENQPECAFYKKNQPESAFSLILTSICVDGGRLVARFRANYFFAFDSQVSFC